MTFTSYLFKKLFTSVVLTLVVCSPYLIHAQSIHVFEDWNSTGGSQNFFYKNTSKTDGPGNVYVVGATLNTSGNYDILVSKYDNLGALTWSNTYSGAANMDDIASDVYIDASGNVFVTGSAVQSSANSQDLILIKYNSAGDQQWVSFYNNPAGSPVPYDGGTCLTMDGSGNIYVGGGSVGNGTGSDYITIKFNASGTLQWDYHYNYNDNNDLVTKIEYNSSTNKLIVSGGSQRAATRWDYATVSYSLVTAAAPTVVRSSGTADGIDQVTDMVTDGAGNIYITGTSKKYRK